MDDVWSDTDTSMTPLHSSSFLSTESSSTPPTFLTTYQTSLISAYTSHSNRVSDLMNTVVDLEISVRRERDESSLPYLAKELERAQEDLLLHRDAKRKKKREIEREEENLKTVVGNGSEMARRQLNEIGTYMERERTIVCLR
ncbi:uncharacterized protein ALTATR162_LOCUS6253 [Alternaria atra]|uniref:Uncharacterized protein n=1 Tax=Alternaria atra TaxID=119953 RepID=A0A8J2N787_9PLEO|nr:uncharacterized protein ALTATR162_LOCUS6253 [Alternaria atra]CAG5162615.1 unnamed protein product [Alternaria atra]